MHLMICELITNANNMKNGKWKTMGGASVTEAYGKRVKQIIRNRCRWWLSCGLNEDTISWAYNHFGAQADPNQVVHSNF